jgi:hypothetical protein
MIKALVERNENIVAVPFKDPVKRPMQITWNHNVPHNSAFYDFMDFVKENLAKYC